MQGTDLSLSRTIAEHIAQATFTDLPDEAVAAAKRSLLDGLGVILAASRLGEGSSEFADLVLAEGGIHESSVLGRRRKVPAASAAWANGAASHAIDFEDAFDEAPVHPNAQVLPAVVALAESRNSSGTELLTAIAVGCDLTCRVALAMGAALNDRGWYPPPILGTIGATAGCANLLGLSTDETVNAISLAIMQTSASGEIKTNPSSTIRAIRDAFPAHVAVRSSQLATRGVRGFDRPLEGSRGFFAVFAGGQVDTEALLSGLGKDFNGARVSFKPWPSCRGTHPFIQAALELRGQVQLGDVARVVLKGAPTLTMLAEPAKVKRRPRSAIDAKFSVMFTVATALTHGEVALDSFNAEGLIDTEVLRIAELTEFTPVPELSRPSDMTAGTLSLITHDGRTLSKTITSPVGNPNAPLPTSDLVEKFVSCARSAYEPRTDEQIRAAATGILTVETLASVRDLFAEL